MTESNIQRLSLIHILTGKDVLFSAVTSLGGDLVGAAKTTSTARNQLIDGATDNLSLIHIFVNRDLNLTGMTVKAFFR